MEKIGDNYYPFINLPLPYAYGALEPYIDAKTMQLHHGRHLQAYVDNLNALLKENPRFQTLSLKELVTNPRVPTAIKNNAGGVFNHRFFFDGMKNPAQGAPSGGLSSAINSRFGNFNAFKAAFKAAALSVFGSGYAWLVTDRGRLEIATTPNQNTPLDQNLCPVLTLDVWEHAYYLKHYNLRAAYVDDWFNVIDWDKAGQNYQTCFHAKKTA